MEEELLYSLNDVAEKCLICGERMKDGLYRIRMAKMNDDDKIFTKDEFLFKNLIKDKSFYHMQCLDGRYTTIVFIDDEEALFNGKCIRDKSFGNFIRSLAK